MATAVMKLLLPMLPNYIKVASTDALVDIADLSDDEIKRLCAEWTEAMLAHAKKRREHPRRPAEGHLGRDG